MNKLIVPAVVAVLAGVGGGSGVAYVRAKKAAVVVGAHLADSVKAHVKDSTEKAEKKAKAVEDSATVDSAAMGPLTPADSIRAARNLPTTLSEATHGLANAVDPMHPESAAKVDPKHPEPVAKIDAKAMGDPKTKPGAVEPAKAVEPVHAVPPQVESALPEKRIAKIFGAMQSKDAARVLEQMNDSDVRIILGLMPDKQAAAILSTFPPQRAAAISRGESKKEIKTEGKTETKADKKASGATP